MKIPTSFKLGAHTWKVKIVDEIGNQSDSFHGICYTTEHLIKISRKVNGKKVSDASMYQTFLHEFVHAALHILGREDDEELAAGLEQMYYQLYKTARYPKTSAPARDKA
jgi:hypothetical protein